MTSRGFSGKGRGPSRGSRAIGGPLWVPTDQSGLALWLDSRHPAGALAAVPADNTALATWADLSGNGRDLTQATSGSRPLFRSDPAAALPNGVPTITFDGTDDYMASAAVAVSQPLTIYVFGKMSATDQAMFSSGNGNPMVYSRTGENSIYAGSRVGLPGGHISTRNIYTGVYNGASSFFYINGQQRATGNVGVGNIASFRIGRFLDASTIWSLNGDIAVVLVYTGAHDATVRAQVHGYIASVYGATLV
jgi:hypothetical protein